MSHAITWEKNVPGGIAGAKALRQECAWPVCGVSREPEWLERSRGEGRGQRRCRRPVTGPEASDFTLRTGDIVPSLE